MTNKLLLFAFLFIFCFSCKTDPPVPIEQGIIDTWISTGDMLSPLQQNAAELDSMIIRFETSGTYNLTQVSISGDQSTQAGIYEITTVENLLIAEIMMEQSNPSNAEFQGIFRVVNNNTDSLYLEVVQTFPYIGFSPPNLEDQFGSSNNGLLGRSNVQIFIRKP